MLSNLRHDTAGQGGTYGRARVRPRAVSAAFFSALAVLFAYLLIRNFDPDTVQFVRHGRHSVTSFDRLLPLALLTTICIVIAVKSLVAILSDRPAAEADHVGPNDSPAPSDSPPTWVCPWCGEDNPGSFGECWKCQRVRASEDG